MLSNRSTYRREAAGEEEEVTAVTPGGFDTVGLQMHENQARLLFGRSPYEPRIAVPLARVAASGDISDLTGYLNTKGARVSTLLSDSATVDTLDASYINSDGGDIDDLTSQTLEVESITTGGVEAYVDWNLTDTKLPALAIVNNPLRTGYNSDGNKGNFSIGDLLISAGEAAAVDALLYLGKAGGGWLLSAAQDGISMMSGYASIGSAGLSIGADAAGAGAALGGDAAIFEAGSSGMVLASTASEAASLFSSAGVLAEGGVGFASAEGEIGEALLSGIENSSGSFSQEALPDFFDTLLGSGRWVAL